MKYRIVDEELIIVRLDPGDEIMDSLVNVCTAEGCQSAEVYGVGVTKEMKLNNSVVFNDGTKYEIASLMGSVTLREGRLFPHIHLACAAPDCTLVGGHLNYCIISGTCEIFMRRVKTPVGRFEVPDRPGVYWWKLD